jgi:RND family efflux transporter MFP subunit
MLLNEIMRVPTDTMTTIWDKQAISAIGGFGLGCALLVLAGCGGKAADGQAAGPQAMPVQVQVVESREITNSTEYLSILKSRHSANINPQVEGYITKIFVKSGDRVAQGAPLLQVDPLKQEAAVQSQEMELSAQEADVHLAQITMDRNKKLVADKVISQAEYDNAQMSYEHAVARLRSLEHQVQQEKVQLRYFEVKAPMAGIVGDIPVRVGDRVSVSTLLTTVDEPGALEAYIYVPASRAGDLRVGLPVKLLDEKGALSVDTKITFVSPQADQETQTVLVKAAVPNAKASLRIAQQVRAQVDWGTRQGPVIPVLAVQRINGEYFAFVAVNEGKGAVARQKQMSLGEMTGNDYAVLGGVKAGDHLIVSGTQFLQDGMPVMEMQKEPGKENNAAAGPEPGAKAK